MSELKTTHIKMVYNGEIYDDFGTVPCTQLYYRKSEVDNVIAKKDAEIAGLKAIRKVHVEAIESMGAGLLQDEEEKRHSKYKRCLGLAMVCECRTAYTCGRRLRHNLMWRERWLELAEKFKEAKP